MSYGFAWLLAKFFCLIRLHVPGQMVPGIYGCYRCAVCGKEYMED